jgi:hypothetical protein
MKNYSRQFGDSKISDDVMIRADVSAQMGLTAAFSAKICEFYRPYPYFFVVSNSHSCAHLTQALNLRTEEVMKKIVQLIF